MKHKLLTNEELEIKLKECSTLLDEIFNQDFIQTSLFVYQIDEEKDCIYTSVSSTLDFEQLRFLLHDFISDDDDSIEEVVDTKPLLN